MKSPVMTCLFLLILILTACSGPAQPTATSVPEESSMPDPTRTDIPIHTPLHPTGTPATASEWNGIPIMPGALTGDGDEDGYVFTIKATPQQVWEYYELEMGTFGWQSSAEGDGLTSLTLTFTNEGFLPFTVNVIAKGDKSLVLLSK